MLAAAPFAHALERQARVFDHELGDEWNAGATCAVQYFNTCTGWIWCWDFSASGARAGTVFEACGDGGAHQLISTSAYFCTGVPCGRGFTGSIAFYAADANGCPAGQPIAKQAFCPPTGWSTKVWNIEVPSPFVMILEASSSHPFTVFNPASDHPSAGATGPAACGTCYPSDRPTRSFDFGTAAAPLCPPEPLDDGICNAELLLVASFASTVQADPSSWSKIKTLFK